MTEGSGYVLEPAEDRLTLVVTGHGPRDRGLAVAEQRIPELVIEAMPA